MRTIPDFRIIRSGDIDAAPGADRFGKRKPFDDIREIRFARLVVRIEHVLPRPDFRDHYVFRGIGRARRSGVFELDWRTVGRAVAEAAMFTGEFARIGGRFQVDRPAEADGTPRRSQCRRGGESGQKMSSCELGLHGYRIPE